MAIVGIDLGTTNSLITAFVDGKSVLIPNSYNEYLTPSVVSLTDNDELLVGRAAKERLITNPDLSASLFKRYMGTKNIIKLGKKRFLPEELSSIVLRQLLADAENYLQEPVTEAIISVPAYFNANQRSATKTAGMLSGVKVERLVNEPSAAALAYRGDDDDTFIILDFGGGTLDISIVEIFDNVVNICAIAGSNFLGGIDFDQAIAEAACAENDIDPFSLSRQEFQILLRAAEMAKIRLGTENRTDVTAILQNKKVSYELTNERLFQLSNHILERLKNTMRLAVKDSGLSISEISKCILIGGSCHMPIIREYLDRLLRIPVFDSLDVDKAVAIGLGLYAGIKERKQDVKDLVLTDICPFSLNVDVYNEQNPQKALTYTLIQRNTILPTRVTRPLWTVFHGQTDISIRVNQGEQFYADENILLGNLNCKVPYNAKDYEKIEVTFSYDINAILAVDVEVCSTGAKHALVLTGDGLNLSEKQIEKYVNDIKNLKLAHLERAALLLERAKRVYAESDEIMRHYVKELILSLEKMEQMSSIRRTNKILDSIESNLADIEKNLGADEIFNNMSVFLRLIKGGGAGDDIGDDTDE